MRRFAVVVALAGFVAMAPAAVAAQDPPKPEQQKAEKPSYAGKWNMALNTPNGSMAATLEMALDEKEPNKVKGSLASEMGTMAIYGEIAEGVLWFALSPDGTMEIWFNGKLLEDGSLAGGLDMQGNQIPWTATRVK